MSILYEYIYIYILYRVPQGTGKECLARGRGAPRAQQKV